ncbi:AraC-like DNA-binding protein [Filimonas zeae]|uniref:AraC family transcriptional regulator n=1 Tax=Filimonas zeae TaxID=1737353 RepID=A0A917INR7_9BACT|nr:helix-turn-helix domain-containing protein [Filimonas zeae]MDR6337719.1 AraC-like DNA-binding protein [Filimonas zeae]GGH59934.1 AraC family transcriptional regulator [Filimonas zeae]
MEEIKTFSLARHGRLFAVADNSKEYLFVQAVDHPYLEEPYRAESYALAFLKKGGIHLQAGLIGHRIEAPAMIALGPSVIRSFSKSSDALEMDILFFKDSFLLEKQADRFLLMKYDFFENNELHILPLAGTCLQKIQHIYDLLVMAQEPPHYYQAEITCNYIFVLIYELDTQFRQLQVDSRPSNNLSGLFTQFRQLLARNYLRERKLGFYADQLHVTAKYLSATIKKQTGKSAGEWIDEAVTLEARVLLQNKALNISQISNQLNFPDQSVFGKFFKSNTGMSPMDYRRQF